MIDKEGATAWAWREFGQAELGDVRRTRRAVKFAAKMVCEPACSIPRALSNECEIKGAYRLIENDGVSHSGLLSGHVKHASELVRQEKKVLVIQDTTSLNFGEREGLGPIHNRLASKGMYAHTALAVTYERHEVLGVLDQQVWVREEEKRPRNESGRARKKRERESAVWRRGQERVAEVLGRTGKGTPRVIAVFDREGDIFESFEELERLGHSFIIRATRNRLLDTEATGVAAEEPGGRRYLLDEVMKAPIRAHKEVTVPARNGRPGRIADLEIRAMEAVVRPPANRERRGESLSLNIVLAVEPHPPAGSDPLIWYLVTREPIITEQDVLEVVRGYEARWLIEEFHMGLKTGCRLEDRQMETRAVLENFLAFATVIAWQMLALRDIARRPESIAAQTVLRPTQLEVLQRLKPRLPKECTAREALRAIATLGGFMNRKGDGEPGWRTLWRGLEKLASIESGYLLALEKCGQ